MLVRSGPSSSRLWTPDAAVKALLEAVPSAVAVLDPHGHIACHNAAWAALGARTSPMGELGSLVTAADHDASPYLRRLAALDGPLAMPARRIARAAQEALAGRPHEARIAYRVRRPDGEEPFEAILSPMPSDKGPLVVLQHLDVGARERAAEAEALALEMGVEAEALRSRSRTLARRVAAIGQEMHTPITPVRLELYLLLAGSLGPLTPAQSRALEVAARNVARWAEGEQAFLRLPAAGDDEAVALDLTALAHDAVDARQTQALQQGIRLLVPARTPPLPVKVRPDLVRDALDRFLDHALAASPSGSAVAIEAQAQDGEAVVAIVDSGAGLSPRELRNAFEPWGGRRHEGGKDLALHYARIEVERAGGRAWAESDGHGQGLLLGMAFPLLHGGGFDRLPAAQGAS